MSSLKKDHVMRSESGDIDDDFVEVLVSYILTSVVAYLIIGITMKEWNLISVAMLWGLPFFVPAWLVLRFTGLFDRLRMLLFGSE